MILDFTFYVAKVTKLFAFFIILRQIVCTYKQKKSPTLSQAGEFKKGYENFINYETQKKVELEGVEPSSKRGNHKLSTCLSLTSFSSYGRTKAINRNLIS